MNPLHLTKRFRSFLKLDHDNVLRVKSEFHDQDVTDLNQSLRNSGAMTPGRNDAPVHPDGAKVIYWFQADEHSWAFHKKQHPELHESLHSKDQIIRERAAATIAQQHPEWIVCAPSVHIPVPIYAK